MKCPDCLTENSDRSRFCSNCGLPLQITCPSCKAKNLPGAKFCVECGTKIQAAAAVPVNGSSDHQPQAERRHLTVLFSDLVGSTELSEQLDPEDLQAILHQYQVACTKVVALYEGYLAKYLGDGILAYFGFPSAHEDDANRAIQAGLGIVASIKSISAQFAAQTGIAISVRVGIHTGLVVVGDIDQVNALESNAIVGHTPNLAARLQSVAKPNTVVISSDTYKLIRGYFEAAELGSHELKGVSQPVQLYRIEGESNARSRLDAASGQFTPFAGRENEINLLKQAWQHAREGKGQVGLLGGEAGIGKSRLLLLLKEAVSTDPDSWLTELRCSAYHTSSSFYPIIDFHERVALQFEKEDSTKTKLSKIEGLIALYGLDAAASVPLLAGLLSVPLNEQYAMPALTPQRQKMKTIDLLITLLLHRAALQPVLFIAEDLHWADPSTLELLDKLIEQSGTHHIFILLTYRPQFKPYWHNQGNFTHIELTGLTKSIATAIITRVAENKRLPKEAVEYIFSKTDGIPLFLEEMTKSMMESDILLDKGDHYELSGPINTLGVPSTIQDSLMARLDRLPEAKNIAQLAAVIGRSFTYEMLDSIPGKHKLHLTQQLERLVQAGILYQKGIAPHSSYFFKHALIQDSAYSSLLKSSRKDYHRLIAESLELHALEIVETQPELLAQHYAKAFLPEKAIQYWLVAGIRALQRSANLESISHLKQGILLTEHITDLSKRKTLELQLYSAIGPALIATRGFGDPEIMETYKKANELSSQLGDGPLLFTPLWGQWVYYLVRGDLHKAEMLAKEMERLGNESGQTALQVEADWTLGNTNFWLANYEAALSTLNKAITIYDPKKHHQNAYIYGQDPGVAAHCYRMYTLWNMGFPQQAYEAGQAALALAEKLSHPFSMGWALAFNFTLDMLNQDHRKSLQSAAKTVAYCTEQVYPFWLFAALCTQGWATSILDSPKKGLPLIEQGLDGWKMIGSVLVRPVLLNQYAEALCLDDQPEKALAVAEEALCLAKEINELDSEIDLYRVKGNCLLHIGKLEEAEASIRYGIELAKKYKAISKEMKAMISLSGILKTRGREKEGIGMVKETLAKFTEGFDTTFLTKAREIAYQ